MLIQSPLYDLMLVISAAAEEDRRAKILSDVEERISAGEGTLERNDDWRTRALAYEIRHQREGEYHLLQFTGPPALLESLSHSLRIDDAVLRFRIIKVVPGTPPPPDAPAPVVTAAPAAAAPAETAAPAAAAPAETAAPAATEAAPAAAAAPAGA